MTVIESTSKLIGFDLKNFFDRFDSFLDDDLDLLKSYYQEGREAVNIKDILLRLNTMSTDVGEVYAKISKNKLLMDATYYHEVIDVFEDIAFKIETFMKLPYWMSVNGEAGEFGVAREYQLSEHETYEQALGKIGFSDRDEALTQIQVKDGLEETDYNLEGGTIIKYTSSAAGVRQEAVSTLVGPLNGDLLYGKDLERKIKITPDEDGGDLSCITGRDCFVQTCGTLLNLKLGGNPEVFGDGVDKALISTKDILYVGMPVLINSMQRYVSKDDTISSFKITKVRDDGDAVYIDTEFNSRVGQRDAAQLSMKI
jgi:hypothetical protein